MSAEDFLQYLADAIFLAIFIAVLWRLVRAPRKIIAHAALLFGDTAAIVLISLVTPALNLTGNPGVQIASGALLLAIACLVAQLLDDVAAMPRWFMPISWVGLVLAVAGLVVYSPPRPGWLSFLQVAYFVGLTYYAGFRFSREALAARGVTSRRLQAIALASVALAVDILVAGFSLAWPQAEGFWQAVGHVSGLVCGIGFFVGFAPPRWLRQVWQDAEFHVFLDRISGLSPQTSRAAVLQTLEEGAARIIGASQAALGFWDEAADALLFDHHPMAMNGRTAGALGPSGTIFAVRPGEFVTGKAFQLKRPLFSFDLERDHGAAAKLYEDLGIRAVLAAPVFPSGREVGVLGIYGGRNWIFAEDDLPLVARLANHTGMVLESHRLAQEAAEVRAEQERQRARERYVRNVEFLASVGQQLVESLDFEESLSKLGQAVIPEMADWSVVHIMSQAVEPRVLIFHVDPGKREKAARLQRDFQDRSAVSQAFETGQRIWTPDLDFNQLLAGTDDPQIKDLLRELHPTSSVIVPLLGRERPMGVLSLLYSESGRRYGSEDVVLIEELAARAGLAIENALLYQARDRERQRLQQIIDAMPEGVFVVDAAGRFLLTNEAATAITGPPDRVSEFPDWDTERFRTADSQVMRAEETPLARALSRNEIVPGQEILLRNIENGSWVPVLATAAPLTGQDGSIAGAVTVFQDISSLKDLERQKDEFLSAAAHDLRTPVTGIRGFAQLMQRALQRGRTIPASELAQNLSQIELATQKMTQLIEELLDLSRTSMNQQLELRRTPVDLITLVQRTADEWRRSTREHVLNVVHNEPSLVGEWDVSRLERAIGNLVGNAIKYSPDGGLITITVEREHVDELERARVTVRDEGIGIADGDLHRIFERFQRGSNVPQRIAGTGIGLAYTKDVIERHGGHLQVESTPGAGSTFVFCLPLHPDAVHQDVPDASVQHVGGGTA